MGLTRKQKIATGVATGVGGAAIVGVTFLILSLCGVFKPGTNEHIPAGGNPGAGDTTGMDGKTTTAEQSGGCFLQTYRNASQDKNAIPFSIIKDGDKTFVTGVTGEKHDQFFKHYFVPAQAGLKSLGTYVFDEEGNPYKYSTVDPKTDIKMCNWTFGSALGERIITPSSYYKNACEIVNFYNSGTGVMPLFIGESKDTGEGESMTPLTIASQNYKGEYTFAQMNMYTNNKECEEAGVTPGEAIYQNGAYMHEFYVDVESYMINQDNVACSYSLIKENQNEMEQGQ